MNEREFVQWLVDNHGLNVTSEVVVWHELAALIGRSAVTFYTTASADELAEEYARGYTGAEIEGKRQSEGVYEDGRAEGYHVGYYEGYDEGYEDGRAEGYDEGSREWDED
jgi:hypothetical protein